MCGGFQYKHTDPGTGEIKIRKVFFPIKKIESLKAHKWDHYYPCRVRVPAVAWMEKDADKQSHWFDMAPDSYLLGIKIEKADQAFVYIVTIPATDWFKAIHDREPMVVQGN